MNTFMDGLGALLFLITCGIIILAAYFLPAIIAIKDKHLQRGAITILNLLLGWTILGWVIALVWACMKSSANNNISYADEIQKLSDLKDKGIITEDEFNKKKSDLLN